MTEFLKLHDGGEWPIFANNRYHIFIQKTDVPRLIVSGGNDLYDVVFITLSRPGWDYLARAETLNMAKEIQRNAEDKIEKVTAEAVVNNKIKIKWFKRVLEWLGKKKRVTNIVRLL